MTIVYRCEDCERSVTGSPFLQSCQDCGGVLRSVGTRGDPENYV